LTKCGSKRRLFFPGSSLASRCPPIPGNIRLTETKIIARQIIQQEQLLNGAAMYEIIVEIPKMYKICNTPSHPRGSTKNIFSWEKCRRIKTTRRSSWLTMTYAEYLLTNTSMRHLPVCLSKRPSRHAARSFRIRNRTSMVT
jgi:hypothetical protein